MIVLSKMLNFNTAIISFGGGNDSAGWVGQARLGIGSWIPSCAGHQSKAFLVHWTICIWWQWWLSKSFLGRVLWTLHKLAILHHTAVAAKTVIFPSSGTIIFVRQGVDMRHCIAKLGHALVVQLIRGKLVGNISIWPLPEFFRWTGFFLLSFVTHRGFSRRFCRS